MYDYDELLRDLDDWGMVQPRAAKAIRKLLARVAELEASAQPLTAREMELIDGMIEVHLHHAKQCDGIANQGMAEKQKAWDMERVDLLRKLGATLNQGSQERS